MSTGVIDYSLFVVPAELLAVAPVHSYFELDSQEKRVELLPIVFFPNFDIVTKVFDDFNLHDKPDEHFCPPLTLDQRNSPIDIHLPGLSHALPFLQIVLALLSEL